MKKFFILSLIFLSACGSAEMDEATPSPSATPEASVTPIPNPEFHEGPDGSDVIPDQDEPARTPDAEVM